jgi:hypothetical protein
MSVGSLVGLAGSVAATQLAQTAGSEIERGHQAADSQERRVENEQRAESAGGIGEADGDNHETSERDADGRRLWERSAQNSQTGPSQTGDASRVSKDASRQSGNLVDLTG